MDAGCKMLDVFDIMNKMGASILLCWVLMFTAGCQSVDGVNVPEKPYEKLSDYGFFTGDLANLEPNDRVLPYDLNSPLFTDYAHKARFVWMPDGTSAAYTPEDVLNFPEGTVLIKNFYYQNDETDASKGQHIIETRLLINRSSGWEALGYIWNEDQTEALHEVVGGIKDVSWVNAEGVSQTIDYVIPNKNQCKTE